MNPENKEIKSCMNCGGRIDAKAEICPLCGVRQPGSHRSRDRVVAGTFGILLGGFGIHKFYLGKVGQGILYLLFCWTIIPSIVGLIEGIRYLVMSEEKFAQKYGP